MPSFGIVQRLPPPLQRAAIRAAERLRAFLEQRANNELPNLNQIAAWPPRAGRAYAGQRVAVAGLLSLRSGLQRGAELMLLDLAARGIETFAFDFTRLLNEVPNLPERGSLDWSALAAFAPSDIVIHINPPLFSRAITLCPGRLRQGATLIGYWAWELNAVGDDWIRCAHALDEIWCPSPFTANALAGALPHFRGRIRVVPHAVDRAPMAPVTPEHRRAIRAAHAVPSDAFIAGTSFSFDSNYARKNPCAAIDAFLLAFSGNDGARLIIRCSDGGKHPHLLTHLEGYAGGDPRVQIWDAQSHPIGIADFYGLLDVYISLHRSEGYGLNLAEANQAGLPVIATGWEMAPDIAVRPGIEQIGYRLIFPLDPQGVYDKLPGARWAEPSIPAAASALRKAYEAKT
jgi:glycosyltransferase involved in cell wall biosynthesis